MTMHTAQLRQTDLNLLVVFSVLAEERNVSRAASRLLLSQPAVTRAMQRLRDSFHDELLVRVSGNYELTPKGEALLHELERMLPRLDRLLRGDVFDPVREEARFRIAGTDYASYVIGIPLMKHLLSQGSQLSVELSALRDDVFDLIERGRLDLLLYADDGNVPASLHRSVLYEEEFVCVVSNESRHTRRLTDKQYLGANHIGIVTLGGIQTIPEQRLAAAGVKRHIVHRVPFFELALRMVAETDLVVTVPRRLAHLHRELKGWKILSAPPILGPFRYLMVWHPRMEDDRAHHWLRRQIELLAVNI